MLEKAADAAHARRMLRSLSGAQHTVHTGARFFIKFVLCDTLVLAKCRLGTLYYVLQRDAE